MSSSPITKAAEKAHKDNKEDNFTAYFWVKLGRKKNELHKWI